MYVDYNTPSETVSGKLAINNAIGNILSTHRGSLPGKPTFGSDLNKILFEQLDHITISTITRMISDSLGEFEPRIQIQSVDIKDVPEFNKVVATIDYIYRDNGTILNDTVKLNLTA